MQSGFFTGPDKQTIGKAALLAEGLTQRYFGLPRDEWTRDPYGVFTRRDIHESLHEPDIFAHVVMYDKRRNSRGKDGGDKRYGVVLQDPNILRALLRASCNDLWALSLFILTHELVHITRFRRFGVNFFGNVYERDREEQLVHGLTRDILKGVASIDQVLAIYDRQFDLPDGKSA